MKQALTQSVDSAPLVYFRIIAGAFIGLEMGGALFTSYHRAFVEPEAHFSYLLFPWVRPWPAPVMYLHFVVNAALGAMVAAGYRYRLTAPLLCLGVTSLFLMERGVYINHVYLYCLVSFLLVFVRADRAVSLDVQAARVVPSTSEPGWMLAVLRFQIAVVFVFAGLAKLEPDWLAARPLEQWLSARSSYPLIGSLLEQSWPAFVMAWGGLLFDLLIVPALLWAPPPVPAFVLSIAFHLTNVILFGIGTFPWFSIAAVAIFFPPAAFRRLWWLGRHLPPANAPKSRPNSSRVAPAWLALAAVYVSVQLVLPLRHLFYPGPAVWTEEGRTFAWQMMLRDKVGSAEYVITDPATRRQWRENARQYVTAWQHRNLIGNPDMLLQLAHHVASRYADRGHQDVEVRVRSRVSLNGRPHQPIVDPRVDLARERRGLRPYPWIVPLKR